MRQLPAKPSLEHLKGQAKSLLRALLSGNAGARERFAAHLPRLAVLEGTRAKLADAQFVLAREYGFPSWTRLKAYGEAVAAEKSRETPANSRADRRLVRRQFVRDLAASLVALSRQHDTLALGARFALMPGRDILAVREHLHASGELRDVTGGLIAGLSHPQPRVRFDCANALDHFADERCAEPLRRLLNDPVPRVRRAALHSLGCDACKLTPLAPGEDLLPSLIGLALRDPSIRVRRAAVPLLESYGRDERVQETLRTLALVERDLAIKREVQRMVRRRGLPGDSGA